MPVPSQILLPVVNNSLETVVGKLTSKRFVLLSFESDFHNIADELFFVEDGNARVVWSEGNRIFEFRVGDDGVKLGNKLGNPG